ncbi:MAG: M23 family metallopeptidase [Candidatus Competibacteraceae bacterium]|uniref:Peptidase M23B n=2 Tax=Candidatus Contendibacter odensensis TaxID=1400860 RepID=A0A7U7GG15_9GAMM|nr:M23 family metallopeptidase [Candidatus Competibacteraceae bacterium]MBK8753158.1 M23 family metallopeptidase [Candidatus Competibacteraceae bacterium]CDH47492.1 Peptidase M23B [Candidatus Contendobacter odensis Run_B_J11]
MWRWAKLIGLIGLLLWIGWVGAGELNWQGQMTQGGLIIGRVAPGTRLELDGQPLPVAPDGAFVFGFGRDAPLQARLSTLFPDGLRQDRMLAIAQRQYPIQRLDGLPPDKVTPPPLLLDRIRRENAWVDEARRRDIPQPYFLSGFAWPVAGRISGVYGSQRILNGEPRQPHYGVDIAAPVGTPVRAPADGIVTLAEPDLYYTGVTLIIDHGYRLSSTLMHLSRLHAKVGQQVRKGEVVAAVGASGRVTGPHLDWRMNWREARIDPALLVPPMP